MCASQRTDPTQRTVTQHLHTFSHLQARSSGCSERSQGCFCSRSEARSGLIRFFGFNLVACPSRVFPSRLFFSFSCAVLLDLVCARRSYIHRLLLLLLLAGRPLLVTWCAAMVSLPPAGFSAVAVWLVGWFPWSSSAQSANQREDFNTTQWLCLQFVPSITHFWTLYIKKQNKNKPLWFREHWTRIMFSKLRKSKRLINTSGYLIENTLIR